ncbi:hypothetical protein [Caulobacter sp. LARHSG274]
MTVDEIDHDLKLLAEQAGALGNEDDGPGLILLSSDTWCRPGFKLGHVTTNIIRGIRYRAIRVFISSKFEDKVLSRREALAYAPGAFEPLEAKAAAAGE